MSFGCPSRNCGGKITFEDGKVKFCRSCNTAIQVLGCPSRNCQLKIPFPQCNYIFGTLIACGGCRTRFRKVPCVHCDKMISLKREWNDEDIIQCGSCKKKFQFYFCPHCRTKIDYPSANYKSGKVEECPHCSKQFQQQNCFRCKKSLVWKNADCVEGKIINCPTCMNKFSFIFCPHCDRKLLSGPDYVEGRIQKCTFRDCGKQFQQLGCVHCLKSIIFKNADYKEGSMVTCPKQNCQRMFQQINCPCCMRSIIWKNGDKNYFQGTVRNCPLCMNMFQHFNCQYCRNPMTVKQNFVGRGMMIQCPYNACKKQFNPFHDITKNPVPTPRRFSQMTFPGQVKRNQNQADSPQPSPQVAQTIRQGRPYIDKDFPPSSKSIGLTGENYDWRRVSEILGPSMCLFDDIEADDIKQGSLGNCWFLSAISILCAYPTLIEKMFITRKINRSGIYEVQFCKGGQWIRVVVDDYLPVHPGTKKLAFSKPNGKEIWVLILEKAYAKLHGSYGSIESGFAHDALSDLTGYPVGKYSFTNDEHVKEMLKGGQFFNVIFQHFYMGHCLALTTKKDVSKDKTGLVPGHCYSLLDMSPRHRLVRIRNPWANFESKLPYNDQDYMRWTDELKRELVYEDKDDGSFWIHWSDLVKYFTWFGVGMIHPKWTEKRSHVVDIGTSFIVSVFHSQTKIVGGIHQTDKRGQIDQFTYKPIGFIITTMDGNIIHYEGMKLERTHHSILVGKGGGASSLVTVSPGRYLFVPIYFTGDKNNQSQDIYVSFHSNNKINMETTSFNWRTIPEYLSKSYLKFRKMGYLEEKGRMKPEKTTISRWKGNEFHRHRFWINEEILLFVEWKVKGEYDKVKFEVKWTVSNMEPMLENSTFEITPGKMVFAGWYVRKTNEAYSFRLNYSWQNVV